jgi:hypothetical protein
MNRKEKREEKIRKNKKGEKRQDDTEIEEKKRGKVRKEMRKEKENGERRQEFTDVGLHQRRAVVAERAVGGYQHRWRQSDNLPTRFQILSPVVREKHMSGVNETASTTVE